MAALSRAEIREKKTFEVTIEDYGFTGEGYLRLSDGWLSVAGALPGERLRVRLQEGQREGARRLFADIVEIIEPSDQRRDPLCARDDRCRGCQLRHLTIAEELRFKVNTIREVISRYGGLCEEEQPLIEVVTPQPIARGDAFRIRSHLGYRRQGNHFELGLFSARSPTLIPMEDCPALTAPAQRLVATVVKSLRSTASLPWDEAMVDQVRHQVRGFDIALGITAIAVVAPTYGVGLIDVHLTQASSERHLDQELRGGIVGSWLDELSGAVPDQVGIAVKSGEHRRYLREPRRIHIPIDKWRMQVGFDDWFHATLEPAEVVYDRLLEWLHLDGGQDVLDIGCGTGTISLMVSEHARSVVGIDANQASIAAAELNAGFHGRDNIRFIASGWEKGLRRLLLEAPRFTAATLNPMREPLGRRPLALLQALGVQRVVYLGPSPKAAAKDIAELIDMGFVVDRLAAANLHPATYHTLLMARLTRPG